MDAYVLLAFIIWWVLGYVIFYFRYKDSKIVDELRANLKDANKEIHRCSLELDEYMQQNELLKLKMTEYLEKNDDLSKVVSELSKYYYHIKKASEKTEELSKFLQEPDSSIEDKMLQYMEQHSDDESNDDISTKSFF